jgi:hypothetical protein
MTELYYLVKEIKVHFYFLYAIYIKCGRCWHYMPRKNCESLVTKKKKTFSNTLQKLQHFHEVFNIVVATKWNDARKGTALSIPIRYITYR